MNQPDNNILNELRELSPAVAAIPRVNVFSVPEGYFDHLPALLLLQTSGTEAGNMNNATVPDGYFDNLASSIMARIKKESVVDNEYSSLLAGIGNSNVFTVTPGYFEGLSSVILRRIKSEVAAETSEISELVAGIGNKNVFTVPQGYFNDLPADILSKLAKPAKVVQMGGFRKYARYAAAAVITGFVAMSTIFILNKNTGGTEMNAETVAALDSAKSIIQTNSFDKEMASLSDADIVNFLESKGQDVDAALVASLTEDEKKLPEEEDYLLNENTLDEILKDLDLNN